MMKIKDIIDNDMPNEVTEILDRNGIGLSIECFEYMDMNMKVLKTSRNPDGITATLDIDIAEYEMKERC